MVYIVYILYIVHRVYILYRAYILYRVYIIYTTFTMLRAFRGHKGSGHRREAPVAVPLLLKALSIVKVV
jgi:hypothetical protein